LVVTAVLTIVTLVLFLSFASKNKSLEEEIANDSLRVNQLKSREELLLVIKDKLSVALILLGTRQNYPSFFEELSTLVPRDLYFTDMKVTGDEIIISGKARTSSDIAGFANALLSLEGASIISNVGIDSLSSDETGVYTFVVSGMIIEEGLDTGNSDATSDSQPIDVQSFGGEL
jgi:Tfp pilus assembly protein PilN